MAIYMVINWYGEGCFKVTSGELTLVSDPFESGLGLTPPRFKTDIILKTGPSGEYISEKESEGRNIMGPGEYEVKGADIMGYPSPSGAVYYVKLEDAKLVFLGGLAEKELPADTMAELRSADIMFVPVGGKPYLDSDDAASLIKKLEPKVVIPCFYKTPGLKRKADDVKDFEKAFGQKAEPQEKLTIKAKDMTWEGIKLVVLKI